MRIRVKNLFIWKMVRLIDTKEMRIRELKRVGYVLEIIRGLIQDSRKDECMDCTNIAQGL